MNEDLVRSETVDAQTNLLEKDNKIYNKIEENSSKREISNKKKRKRSENETFHSNFEMLLYLIIITFLLIVLVCIFYYIHYGEYKVEVLIEDKDMIKPVIDMRKYKLIKLQNNLDVLLISDKNSTKCSAGLSVGVGSMKDDVNIPGLAHLTEHLLFLGSVSYPKPWMFEGHLSNYLGSTNAYTEEEKTTFYFEVEWHGFSKALEMFSRMFAEPLFDINYLKKEIDAVNSENEKNINKDPWRENQVMKALLGTNKTYPFPNFSTGSKKTFTSVDLNTLQSRVKYLYDKYYMPDNMKLVVLSNQNLEQIQELVAYHFSDIKAEKMEENLRKSIENVNINNPYDDVNILNYTQVTGQAIWYQKITGGQHLDIVFNLDEIFTKYQTKPLDYVSYLFKFSGQGSLIDYLKKSKLATKLEVGMITSFKHFSQYAISIYLTTEGLEKISEVVQLTFNYINLIKSNPIKSSTYEELQNITAVQFKFLEKTEKYGEYLGIIAGNMMNIKEKDYKNILFLDYIHSNYDKIMIKSYLDNLTPQRSFIIVGSSSYPKSMDSFLYGVENQIEKWYGTVYKNKPISNELLNNLGKTMIAGETFKLREKNQFITGEKNVVSCYGIGIITSYKNVTLHELCDIEKADLTPDMAINSTNLLAWYKLDRTFLTPKVDIYLLFVSPFLRSNVIDYLALKIYFNYIKTTIELKLADAKDAGNELNISFDENGILIFISSYTDLIETITDRVTQIIFNSEIDQNNLNQIIEFTKNQLDSSKNDQPFEKALNYFSQIIKNGVFSNQDMSNIIGAVNYSEFSKQYKQIQKTFYVISQFYGNINQLQLLRIESFIQPYLSQDVNYVTKQIKEDKIVDFIHFHNKIDGSFVFRAINDLPTELNNVIVNLFQIGRRDISKSLMMSLIELSWGNMFFFNLRTQKQYGYIVSASKYTKDNFMYFMFIVQGSKLTPSKINIEIDSVITMARNRLEDLDEDQLTEYKETLIAELNKRENNLKERSDFVWKEVYENSLDFNRRYTLIEELKNIRKDDLIEFFERIFYYNVNKLSIQMYSQFDYEEALILVTNEQYNLNKSTRSLITNDLHLLRKEMFNNKV